jgi:protein SCO1
MDRRKLLLGVGFWVLTLGTSRADTATPTPESPADGAAGGWVLRPFMLEDVNGTIVDDSTLHGKFSLVFFGYTSCPDICPTALLTISAALKSLGKDADRVLPLFVTLDPKRDTRKVLAGYAASFDPRIVALRGPQAYTDAMAKAFGIDYRIVTPDPAKPDEYSVDHTASITFLGPDGNLITRFGHGIDAELMAAKMRDAIAATPDVPVAPAASDD